MTLVMLSSVRVGSVWGGGHVHRCGQCQHHLSQQDHCYVYNQFLLHTHATPTPGALWKYLFAAASATDSPR